MAKIPEKMRWIYDLLLTAAILAMATVLCTLLRRIDDGSGYVNLIFVLAVATISRWTEGYFWGIFSAVSGVLFVNYVFTYPYWEFNFTITGYPFTFLAMLTVSMMISAMNTQIKKQERLRIETEKEAVRANLLRAMSHDIRTPLTSIVGNTAAILENEDSFSPEQKRRLLEDVNEDAQWLIRMVENLLSITRMSGGQAKIEKDCEAAEEIVGVSVSKFTKRFPAIKVSIEVPDEVLMVPMDATLIRQVIMNLLENALEANEKAPEGAEKWLRVTMHLRGEYLYVGVENARFAPVNFDPEEGLYNSTKPGTLHGMGLKSARATARKYHSELVLKAMEVLEAEEDVFSASTALLLPKTEA